MARMSNKDRIARAAEEARVTAEEKAAKKAAKPAAKSPAKPRARAKAEPARMKVIWEVCNATGKPVKSFAYPDKAKAEAEIQALIKSTGRTHLLRATKVPME
jgi:23S rRNA-/tRNA-specific pseudouridylate synthase